jgi:uncharacterized protein YjbJ (UPF0337 family)
MLKVTDVKELGVGLADKTIGLVIEFTGTLAGSQRLKQAGRDRQEAGSERLKALEEETRATSRATEAELQESRQKAYQPPSKRSAGRDIGEQDSAAAAATEKAKGAVKKGFATVTGNEQMKEEAEAQQDKAEAQGQAAKHDAKAAVHRNKAEVAFRVSEAERRSS